MTAHVNFSDLMRAGTAAGLETEEFRTQMDFLIGLGVLSEVETLAHTRSVDALNRLSAIKRLILPDGMGERYKVLIQQKAVSPDGAMLGGAGLPGT